MKGRANGGTLLNFTGAGFDMKTNYSCVFSRGSLQMTGSATVLSSVLVQCITPYWGSTNPSGIVQVDLASMDRILPNDCEISESCEFTFFSSWMQVQPKSADAKGGDNITIMGFGFEASASYRCRFEAGENGVNATGILISSSELVCTLPSWRFAASSADILLYQVHTHTMLVNSVNTTTEASFLIPSEGTVGFILLSGWTSHNQSTGASKGGDIILIGGFGFDVTSTDYTCNFDAKHARFSSPATVLSDVHIACPSRWPYAAETTVLRLDKGTVRVPYHIGRDRNETAFFEYFKAGIAQVLLRYRPAVALSFRLMDTDLRLEETIRVDFLAVLTLLICWSRARPLRRLFSCARLPTGVHRLWGRCFACHAT